MARERLNVSISLVVLELQCHDFLVTRQSYIQKVVSLILIGTFAKVLHILRADFPPLFNDFTVEL